MLTCVVVVQWGGKHIVKDWTNREWSQELPRESTVLMPAYTQVSRVSPQVAPLVVCASCALCVHTTCYTSPPPIGDWLCDKCNANQHFAVGVSTLVTECLVKNLAVLGVCEYLNIESSQSRKIKIRVE